MDNVGISKSKCPDKPVVLEHHGVKEIMSLDDMQGYINSGQEVCDKCVHFNCVCETDMYAEILD